jgi:hypothetical protein
MEHQNTVHPLEQSISRTEDIIPIPSYHKTRKQIFETETNPINKIEKNKIR